MVRPGGVAPAPPPPVVGPPGVPPMVGIPNVAPVGPAAAPGSRVLVGFLVTFQNDPNGAFWAIHSGRLQLGRAPATGSSDGIDIALPDPSASSRHASIYADPSTGQAYVEDDGSRNGTFLNEQRLSTGERRQLRDSDRLRIGSTTFVIKLLVS
jgi:pSer/pThr/pTyr-binding forkhead associated (FHA) protein